MIFFGHLGLTGLAAKAAEKSLGKITMDYRVVFIGSILPDVIDKPIGRILFAETFQTGRVFAHTLLFIVLLLGIGIVRYYLCRKNGWLVLAGSCLMHDVFDAMWLIPQTFYWPFYGLDFYAPPNSAWIKSGLLRLISDPTLYIPEIIGFIIILYFIIKIIVRHRINVFIKNGVL
ncbi:metal-dependent hydrolase [Dehalobacter sp. DCM]|uniref:metal-dependent hydrolase n=1 Tax=Dehalobacter sp. DCM TaxID=2907827 RepID=UPI0030813494|nr:metal-dependent hydrolase [Dehalobacter sp. DCM]